MPDFSQRKVGIISCSGEEIAEGTVARLAALKVLHELRNGETVTICLPLFLAGGEGDRAFARFHPTITVDGCDLRCAAHGTEKYSGKPAAGIVVSELAAEHGIGGIGGRRSLNPAGRQAVDVTADRLATLVDQVLNRGKGAGSPTVAPEKTGGHAPVTCSCGSGIPVNVLNIAGGRVEVFALPVIFAKAQNLGRAPGEAADDLLALARIYNDVAPEAEAAWREVLVKEYAAYCGKVDRR